MQVDHLGIRILLQQVVTHSMHQVSLAQANAAVQEQRVVAVLRVIRYLPGRSAGQLVRLALDEILEGESTVQVAGVLERTFNLHGTLGPDRRRGHDRSQRIEIVASFFHGLDAHLRRRNWSRRRRRSHDWWRRRRGLPRSRAAFAAY
ncbi:hypothetical protein FQZ97_623820 [compost metagenome]